MFLDKRRKRRSFWTETDLKNRSIKDTFLGAKMCDINISKLLYLNCSILWDITPFSAVKVKHISKENISSMFRKEKSRKRPGRGRRQLSR
jgi:hypothetical protein